MYIWGEGVREGYRKLGVGLSLYDVTQVRGRLKPWIN